MQLTEAMKRLETVVATTGSPDADTAAIGRALSASSQLKSFLASQDAELAKMLHAVPGAFPEATIADATRCSLSDASKETDRAVTLGHADAMADALASGDIGTGHVDALTRAGRQLDDEQRAELMDQHEELAADAADMTPRDFDKLLKKKVKDLQRESDEERLDRQRRNTRLSIWIDTATNMVHLKGSFDPVTGSEITAKLQDVVASIRAAGIPDTAPSDSLEQQRHLDAIGLAHLVLRDDSGSAGSASVGVTPITLPTTSHRDALVVVDATNTNANGEPIIDHGLPVEIPFAVLRDLFGVESPDAVIVANGIVLHAPGSSTSDVPHGSPTEPNAEHSAGSTQRARCRAAASTTTDASCITSSGGATAAEPISRISCPSASTTTLDSTTTTGRSSSDPTVNSPSRFLTARSSAPARPNAAPRSADPQLPLRHPARRISWPWAHARPRAWQTSRAGQL